MVQIKESFRKSINSELASSTSGHKNIYWPSTNITIHKLASQRQFLTQVSRCLILVIGQNIPDRTDLGLLIIDWFKYPMLVGQATEIRQTNSPCTSKAGKTAGLINTLEKDCQTAFLQEFQMRFISGSLSILYKMCL